MKKKTKKKVLKVLIWLLVLVLLASSVGGLLSMIL